MACHNLTVSLSLSLSLYIYIYTHIYNCLYIYIYIFAIVNRILKHLAVRCIVDCMKICNRIFFFYFYRILDVYLSINLWVVYPRVLNLCLRIIQYIFSVCDFTLLYYLLFLLFVSCYIKLCPLKLFIYILSNWWFAF